jgi:hypothetical protein
VARAQTRPRQVNISYSTLKVILNCIVSFYLIYFKYLNKIFCHFENKITNVPRMHAAFPR